MPRNSSRKARAWLSASPQWLASSSPGCSAVRQTTTADARTLIPDARDAHLDDAPPDDPFLIDELKQLGGDARAYAEAEFAFQRVRAGVAAKGIKDVALFGVAALIVAVFGLGALVVGLLMALAPLVTPWGATAIVAGGLFLIALALVLLAKARWTRTLAAISDDERIRP